jgi:L-threonylcarbamoyladenylate synthase
VTQRLKPDEHGIAEAATLLRAGRLVAFPTETVFGLGANASNPEAVTKLYAAKGRPAFNPLIAHIAEPDEAEALAHVSPQARALIAAFWPGPLTLVLPVRDTQKICDLARAGLDTVGLRCPSHPVALALLRATGRPIVAPSANRSGHISPTSADHVMADLEGRIDAVIDGDHLPVGVESTIVSFDEDRAILLRPGSITRAMISRVLPVVEPHSASDRVPLSPGRLASHYAPRAQLRLDCETANADEAVLDFAGRLAGQGRARIELSATGDLVEAASRLYAALRSLDATGAASIAVAPIPAAGFGEAIRDRLSRAAAPRIIAET